MLQELPIQTDETFRAPPHAQGAEKSILSSMLQDPREYVGRAIEAGFTDEHFYLPGHGLMFSFLVEQVNKSGGVDLVEAIQTLKDRELLDRIGGPSAVVDIFGYAPHAANFDRHLGIVRDKFLLRSMIKCCTSAIASATDAPDDVNALLDATEASIMAVRKSMTGGVADISVAAAVEEWAAEFLDWINGKKNMSGIPSGLKALDLLAGGWCSSEFILVAARPSKGKTALAMNFVNHAAVDMGVPTLVFSMEMSRSKLVWRAIACRSGFDRASVAEGQKPSKDDLIKLNRAASEIQCAKLFIDDRSALSVDAVRAKARRMHRQHNIGLIVVDYLGLMKGTGKQSQFSREREVSEISGGLKALAKDLGIPVICLAQLNREVERRGKTGKIDKPRLSDLKDSGSLEADADKVILIHPVGEDDEEEGRDIVAVDLLLEKNRDGATGKVPTVFRKALSRFEERAWDADIGREKKEPVRTNRWDKNA